MNKILFLIIVSIIFGIVCFWVIDKGEASFQMKSKQGVVYLFNDSNHYIVKGDKIQLDISEIENVSKVYHDQKRKEMRVVTDIDSVFVFSILDESKVLVDGLISFEQTNFDFVEWYNNVMKSDNVFDETICVAGGLGSVDCTLSKSNIMIICKSSFYSCCTSNINYSGCIP